MLECCTIYIAVWDIVTKHTIYIVTNCTQYIYIDEAYRMHSTQQAEHIPAQQAEHIQAEHIPAAHTTTAYSGAMHAL
ncbi:hypothetical protein CJI50_03190 [Bifidobacteriaceae bacterium NR021]|nr:hypothetical protein CJI50_03190 [Bifidobacteriaceae bacterium NR021]